MSLYSSFRGKRTPRSGSSTLFPTQAPPASYLIAHVDGGARGNPGPAGYGVVITDQAGHKVAALSEYLGHQTNNCAEYSGLLAALDYALGHGYKALKVVADSELLVKQIRGEYKVKSPTLLELYQRAKKMIGQLEWFSIEHVLRGGNQEADRLANLAMDKGMGRSKSVAGATPTGEDARRSIEGAAHTNTARPPVTPTSRGQEFQGVVRDGVIVIEGPKLPDGTRVQVRVRD
jgi:ribonuclease HI